MNIRWNRTSILVLALFFFTAGFTFGDDSSISNLFSGSSFLFAQGNNHADNDGKEGKAAGDNAPKVSLSSLKAEVDAINKILEEKIGLAMGGFFDFTAANFTHNPNIFNIGDFELDLEHSYVKFFEVAAAIVLNEDGAEVAVALVDFHPVGGSISPRGKLLEKEGFHIQGGKFDVPFGNDWQFFAAPDRLQVSAPLTTEMIMNGGLNDVGVRLLANYASINAMAYVIRGYGKGNAFGGRLAVTPFQNPYMLKKIMYPELSLGASLIWDVDRGFKTQERYYALDIDLRGGPVILTGEYVLADRNLSRAGIDRDTERSAWQNFADTLSIDSFMDAAYNIRLRNIQDGFHVTGGIDLSIWGAPIIVYGRYEFIRFRRNDAFDIFSISGLSGKRMSCGLRMSTAMI